MDSLLANYAGASSDEEQEDEQSPPSLPPSSHDVKPSTSNSKPSLFLSLPQPKQSSSSSSSSLFSSLPQPKSQSSLRNPNPNSSSNPPNPKRIVQFTPPINPSLLKKPSRDDEDDEDEDEERKRRTRLQSSSQAPSVHSFLSSIPAPKHFSSTLGVLPSSGSGRRSIIETEGPATGPSISNEPNATESAATTNGGYYTDASANYENYASGYDRNGGNYGYYDSYGGHQHTGVEQSAGVVDPNYNNVGVYGDNSSSYGHGYGDYGYSGFGGGSEGMEMQQGTGASVVAVLGKRGRNNNEIPAEIVEVNQDELMKDRPREDQMKLTGIAFGPSHQPVSAKGKPSKLHKRKHQIGSLYHDMRQKEMELQERRARGLLTKAQTQGKYGW